MSKTRKALKATIRRAEAKDAAELSALFSDHAMLAATDVPPHTSIAYWEKKIAALADPSHLPLVSVLDGRIIGLLFLQGWPNHIRRKHAAIVSLLAVAPAHRRSGVGRALMNEALRLCDDWMNVRRVEVEFDDDSEALKRYYASFGFVEEGVKRQNLTRDGRYVGGRVMSRIQQKNMPCLDSFRESVKKAKKLSPLKFTIRPAKPEDAEGFAEVFATRSASSGTLQHPYTSAELWRVRLSMPPTTRDCIFVAVANGRIIANAGIHAVNDNPRMKHVASFGISVKEGFQGRGVGRALLATCLDFADHWANYSRVELTVHADNAKAVKLYKSMGFEHEGRHRDFAFREGGYVDALFMGRLTKALAGS